MNEENEGIHVRNVLCIENGHLKNYKRLKKSQTYHEGLVNRLGFKSKFRISLLGNI